MIGQAHCLLSRAQCLPHLVQATCWCQCLHSFLVSLHPLQAPTGSQSQPPVHVHRGTYLVHGPCRCHCLHDVFPPAVGAHWEAPTNDLAHGGQVGGDAKVCLGAALGYPEAGHDLVKAEQGALLCGNVAQALQQSSCCFAELACSTNKQDVVEEGEPWPGCSGVLPCRRTLKSAASAAGWLMLQIF